MNWNDAIKQARSLWGEFALAWIIPVGLERIYCVGYIDRDNESKTTYGKGPSWKDAFLDAKSQGH